MPNRTAFLKKSLASAACALALWCPAAGVARAQGEPARGGDAAKPADAKPAAPSPQTQAADARALYEDAAKFLERKFDEYERGRVPFSRALEAETREEQRALAVRNAARLAARGDLKGADNYYLARLYQLAGKPEQTVEPARRFLAEAGKAEGEKSQAARYLLASQLAALGRLDEAEPALAEYARNAPASKLDLFRLRLALAQSYARAKRFEQSAAHSAEAFRLAKDAETTGTDFAQRAVLVNSSGVFHARTLLGAKRDAEALAHMKEMLALGFSLPSAHVYSNAVELLAESGHAGLIEQTLADSARLAAAAPEIEIAQWIDHGPAKLAALRGRVVLLDFWATWCGPCRVTMPKLRALHEKFGPRGLTVIGLTQVESEAGRPADAELARLRAFKRELRLPYGFAVAGDSFNHLRYGVRSIPTAFVIDRRGRLRHIAVGAVDGGDERLAGIVETLLDEKP